MHTDKITAIHLIELLIKAEVMDFIISPGSRNAPLINELVHRNNINLYSIPDERSAGFYALGMSLKTKMPTAVICTSGSALLNYLPAVSEAYYQSIPLIVISADRPHYRIDKGEGQTIHQKGALSNFIRAEINIPLDNAVLDYNDLDEKIITAIQLSITPLTGPIHINIEFDEPLYDNLEVYNSKIFFTGLKSLNTNRNELLLEEYIHSFDQSEKIMILCGQMNRNEGLEMVLKQFSEFQNTIILTESTANLKGENIIPSIDKTILTFGEDNPVFAPDLLITIGDAIISKIIKRFLRKAKPGQHWHIHPRGVFRDTYDVLSHKINKRPKDFLDGLLSAVKPKESDFRNKWLTQYSIASKLHKSYLINTPFSDLKVFEFVFDNIPEAASIHISNSSPIRYQQLFEPKRNLITYSNRGTSGIDGCLSTAAGFALKNETDTWLITGDISFLYDSNAWWNEYDPGLKVILINNGGGGIFRILPGPTDIPGFETFFETNHQVKIKELCSAFDLNYFYAQELDKLEENFEKLKESEGVSVLEIKTPRTLNAKILRDYFNDLNNNEDE